MKRWLLTIGTACLAVAAPAQTQPAAQLLVIQRGTPAAAGLPAVGPQNSQWMAAHFINVGQGAATLLEFSCGLVLIDTGGGETRTGDWVGRFTGYLDGVLARRPDLNRRIDVLVLTHPHGDHTKGAPALANLARYRLGHVVTNAQTAGSGIRTQNRLTTFVGAGNVTRMDVSKLTGNNGFTNASIDPLRCNGQAPEIRLLWGSSADRTTWPRSAGGNNRSVVVRVDFGNSAFLITGDLEESGQRALIRRFAANPDILKVDVYEAGHHGSRNGTTPELVRAMRPEMAVIEAGNPSAREPGLSAFNFGHPNQVAIGMLTNPQFGVTMRRPTRNVAVGVSGLNNRVNPPRQPVFTTQNVGHAIFATGWDGNVVVFANMNGEKRVLID
jgi:competence protein ComEC